MSTIRVNCITHSRFDDSTVLSSTADSGYKGACLLLQKMLSLAQTYQSQTRPAISLLCGPWCGPTQTHRCARSLYELTRGSGCKCDTAACIRPAQTVAMIILMIKIIYDRRGRKSSGLSTGQALHHARGSFPRRLSSSERCNARHTGHIACFCTCIRVSHVYCEQCAFIA